MLDLQLKFDTTYIDVLKALLRKNIRVIDEQQTTQEEQVWLKSYFHEKIKCYLVPLLINSSTSLVKAAPE